MADPGIAQKQVGVEWEGLDSLPIHAATTFVAGANAIGEINLAIGQTSAPVFAGTPEEQTAKLMAVTSVNARPLVRLMMTPWRVKELISILQFALDQHELIEQQQQQALTAKEATS